jgi:hypothetical protein
MGTKIPRRNRVKVGLVIQSPGVVTAETLARLGVVPNESYTLEEIAEHISQNAD